MQLSEVTVLAGKIKENIKKVIIGKDEVIELMLAAILAKGHVLLEDVPGTGKTVLAKALAKSLEGSFSRVQFTPDILPSDITGMNVYNQQAGRFEFKKGPVFANVVLADEINRATPRSQSALLECMEERQVTVDGTTYRLQEPFLVIATQNPVETQGTFQLPEAQIDRFFIKTGMGYPTVEEGVAILDRFIENNPLEELAPVATTQQLAQAQAALSQVHVSADIRRYIINLVDATRKEDGVALGVSPRGSLAMLRAVMALAAVRGREYVIPDDVKEMVKPVLGHRLICHSSYYNTRNINDIISSIMSKVEVPTEVLKEE